MTQFDWSMALLISAALSLRIQSAAFSLQRAHGAAMATILSTMFSWACFGVAVIMFLHKFTDLF